MNLVKVVTHDEDPRGAAKLLEEEEIIAVGWGRLGDLKGLTREQIKKKYRRAYPGSSEGQAAKDTGTLLQFRDTVQVGDIVLGYAPPNTVALVGIVLGPYEFNDTNKVGDPRGSIGCPNQRKVKWFGTPRDLDADMTKQGAVGIVSKLLDLLCAPKPSEAPNGDAPTGTESKA